jgi:hypothetical protein
MMNQEMWEEFQETLIAYVELREKFDRLGKQARYGRAPSAKIDGALYEISSKLRDYDGLLLQLCQSMGHELKGEIAELGHLRNELIQR